tara:strand:+ start:524 stop:1951 length:1428 start_codon:yes stop_codon:yes gene_type:complete
MELIQIYDPGVAQYAYILGCENTGDAIVIDPQRNISEYLKAAEDKNLNIIAVTETHIHADFLSGTQEFVKTLGMKAYLSRHGEGQGWAYEWAKSESAIHMVQDGDEIKIGDLKLKVAHTPGHTPEHIAFLVTAENQKYPMGAVTGDFVFVGDLGRPDLLEKAAKQDGKMKEGAESLFKTTQNFKEQADSLIIWPGHGAGSACGKSLGSMPYTTWGYEKQTSPALQYDSQDEFVNFITSAQKEPPLYFARMKHLNRDGSPLLDLKNFKAFSNMELQCYRGEQDNVLLIDLRHDRNAAMDERTKATFYASFGSLSTAVGSMIEETDRPIIFIGEKEQAMEARKRLSNVGYDNIVGYITPLSFSKYLKSAGQASIPATTFDAIHGDINAGNITIVDVRSGPEYENAHIKDAIHAPYTRLPEYIDTLPKDEKLYVHCGSGMRASVAVSYLSALGYDVVLINDMFANSGACSSKTKACAA